jgi:N-acetylglucosaminyldiphosphoundecaprenol N-acetyl-beta-D-mannosaminyltransferase
MGFNAIDSASAARRLSQARHDRRDESPREPARYAGDADTSPQFDLTRPVYCVLGLPVDAVDMAAVVERIDAAAADHTTLLVSTPNLNFLVNSLSDPEFRESLLDSDLCAPDGAPIVWIARLLGLPVRERVAGSDLLDQLQARDARLRRFTVFLFGGAKGVAEAAARTLNAHPGGLSCVGTMDPGFCDVDEMSRDDIIDAINSSGADFLVLALGAKKGQLWLQRNHHRLTIPIRAHLGAAVNFQAGSVKRAPAIVRSWGLEWLWRIKEEHYLWRRYRDDGLVLLRLLLTRILPLAITTRCYRLLRFGKVDELRIERRNQSQSIVISLCGVASEKHIREAIACFQDTLQDERGVTINLSNTWLIDARFLGLLLMLRKQLKARGAKLTFTGTSRLMRLIFRLSGLEFLLATD